MAASAVLLRSELATGFTSTDLTSTGFGTPQCAILMMSYRRDDDGLQNVNCVSIGLFDGTRTKSYGFHSRNGQATMDTISYASSDAFIMNTKYAGEANLGLSFITNGIRITENATMGINYVTVSVLLIKGLSNYHVNTFQAHKTATNTVAVTDPGFTPDALIVVGGDHTFQTGLGAERNNAGIAVGFSTYKNSVITQNSYNWTDQDNVADANVQAYINTSAISGPELISDIPQALRITSYDVNGFTVTSDSSVAQNQDRMYLALKFDTGDTAEFGYKQLPASTGSQAVTGLTLTPIAVLNIFSKIQTLDSTISNDDANVFATSMLDSSNGYSHCGYSDDGAASSEAKGIAGVYAHETYDTGSALSNRASFTSLDSAGWTWNFATLNAASRYYLYFAIGALAAEGVDFPHVASSVIFTPLTHTVQTGVNVEHATIFFELNALSQTVEITCSSGIFPTQWGRKCRLTISGAYVFDDLTDFRLYIGNNHLPSEIFNSLAASGAMDDGSDVRFTLDSSGTQPLSFELVDFDKSTQEKTEFHVLVPSITSGTAKDIWVWYNRDNTCSLSDSDTVWSGYLYVYHMNTPATLIDSSPNSRDLPQSGGGATLDTQDGPTLGVNTLFDGTGYYLHTEESMWSSVSSVTLEVIVSGNGYAIQDQAIVSTNNYESNNDDDGISVRWDAVGLRGGATSTFKSSVDSTLAAPVEYEITQDYIANPSGWHYIASRWESGSHLEQRVNDTLFYDGAGLYVYPTDAPEPSGYVLGSGVSISYTPKDRMVGAIAEIRAYPLKRSDGWTRTAYYNFFNDNFITVGTPQPIGEGVDITHTVSTVAYESLIQTVSIGAAYSQSNIEIVFESGTHTIAGGASFAQSIQVVEFIPGTHISSGGANVQQSVGAIVLIPGIHSIYTGAGHSHSAGIIILVPRSHTSATGASYSHNLGIIELVTGTHSAGTGSSYQHSIETIELLPGTHTASTGAAHSHSINTIEFEPNSHTIQTGISYSTTVNTIEFVPGIHIVGSEALILHSSSIVEFLLNTHTVNIGIAYPHTINTIEFLVGAHQIYTGASYAVSINTVEYIPVSPSIHIGTSFTHSIKSVILAPLSHLVDIVEFVTSATAIVFIPGIHHIYIGAIYYHSIAKIEFIPGSHSSSGGASYSHSKTLIEFITLNHLVDIVEFSHSSITIRFNAGTHDIKLGVLYHTITKSINYQKLTHICSVGASFVHTGSIAIFQSLIHSVTIGALITHQIGGIVLTSNSHIISTGAGYQHSLNVIRFVANIHVVELLEFAHKISQIVFITNTHRVELLEFAHTITQIIYSSNIHSINTGASFQHSNISITFSRLTHYFVEGVDVEHTASIVNFVSLSHSFITGINVLQGINYIEFVSGTHLIYARILKSMENDILSGLLSAIESMSILDGYNYNWTSTQQEDFNKVDSYPHANVYMYPKEESLDSISIPNMNSFRNIQRFEIHCFNKYPTESSNSEFDIDKTLNYMLHDMKKLIGSSQTLRRIAEYVEYDGARHQAINDAQDIFMPKKLIVEITVYYTQDRTEPSVAAYC